MVIYYGKILYFQGVKGLEGGEGGKYIRGIRKTELLATEPPAEFALGFVLSFFLPHPHFAALIPNTWATSANNNKPALNEPTISPATRQAAKITSAFLFVSFFPPLGKCPAFYLSPLLKKVNDGN